MKLTKEYLLPKWADMLKICETLSPWTTGGELAWLAEMAVDKKLIAEIGSYKGKSTKAIAWGSAAIIHCVDTFERGSRTDFERNLKSEFETEPCRIYIHGISSQMAAAKLGHLKFDMIFIDADHDKESVQNDIKSWLPLLASGGLFCGHDAWPEEANNGVSQALRALEIPYELAMDSIWIKLD
jgi:predicted O-methyltransferase YrrM